MKLSKEQIADKIETACEVYRAFLYAEDSPEIAILATCKIYNLKPTFLRKIVGVMDRKRLEIYKDSYIKHKKIIEKWKQKTENLQSQKSKPKPKKTRVRE